MRFEYRFDPFSNTDEPHDVFTDVNPGSSGTARQDAQENTDFDLLQPFDLGLDFTDMDQIQAFESSMSGLKPLDLSVFPSMEISDPYEEATTALVAARHGMMQPARPGTQALTEILAKDETTGEADVIPEIDPILSKKREERRRVHTPIIGKISEAYHRVRGFFFKHKKKAIVIAAATAAGVTALVLLLTLGAFDPANRYVKAQEVYFDGKAIGTVKDSDALIRYVQDVYDDLSVEYGVKVLSTQNLIVKNVRVDERYISDVEELGAIIETKIDAKVNAYVIFIDGMAGVALPTQEDAQWVLDQIKEPYMENAVDGDVGFMEDVKITSSQVSADLLKTREDALDFVLTGVDKKSGRNERYTVQEGDTVASIAERNGISAADLSAINGVTDETLEVGSSLILASAHKLIDVGYKEIITVTETIPYTTEYRKDDSLYIGQTKTTQAGENGEKSLEVEVHYINGQEVSRTTLSETIIKEAVNQIIGQGTKKLPTVVTGVSDEGFMWPCTGTLTSTFKPRWGRFHYGIDIANSSGTPIRASMSGVVCYTGWMGGYGYLVEIDHGNGCHTRYAHNSSILVSVGQTVSQGEVIALMGTTGNSTGNHCHFEIRYNGTAVDPLDYL